MGSSHSSSLGGSGAGGSGVAPSKRQQMRAAQSYVQEAADNGWNLALGGAALEFAQRNKYLGFAKALGYFQHGLPDNPLGVDMAVVLMYKGDSDGSDPDTMPTSAAAIVASMQTISLGNFPTTNQSYLRTILQQGASRGHVSLSQYADVFAVNVYPGLAYTPSLDTNIVLLDWMLTNIVIVGGGEEVAVQRYTNVDGYSSTVLALPVAVVTQVLQGVACQAIQSSANSRCGTCAVAGSAGSQASNLSATFNPKLSAAEGASPDATAPVFTTFRFNCSAVTGAAGSIEGANPDCPDLAVLVDRATSSDDPKFYLLAENLEQFIADAVIKVVRSYVSDMTWTGTSTPMVSPSVFSSNAVRRAARDLAPRMQGYSKVSSVVAGAVVKCTSQSFSQVTSLATGLFGKGYTYSVSDSDTVSTLASAQTMAVAKGQVQDVLTSAQTS